MYSSKTLTRSMPAFTPVSYTSIGDPYVKRVPTRKDEDALRAEARRPERHKGRQFTIPGEKVGGAGAGCFDKLTYKPEPFKDRISQVEPLGEGKKFRAAGPKAPFGSSDAAKRNEFTLHFATEQYRERLKMEAKHLSAGKREEDDAGDEKAGTWGSAEVAAAEAMDADGTLRSSSALSRSHSRGELGHRFMYDKVHAKDDMRLTGVRKHDKTDKHYGPLRTSAQEVGMDWDAGMSRSQFGRVTVTKEFFDTGHF